MNEVDYELFLDESGNLNLPAGPIISTLNEFLEWVKRITRGSKNEV